MTDLLVLAASYALAVTAVGRLTRLAVHDDWPPAAAVRRWWFNHTVAAGGWRARWAPVLVGHDGGSGCPFCFAPYAAAAVEAVAVTAGVWPLDLTTLAGWWWAAAVWASVSYLAAMLVVRDEPLDGDD